MAAEFERLYTVNGHPGSVRALAYLNQAHMGSYEATLDNPTLNMDIKLTREYRQKFGFGLNLEQELAKGVGAFMRLGWSDGRNETWVFTDVDRTASLGLSVKGGLWERPNDTLGLAGAINAVSGIHRRFFAAGGLGILAGDGGLSYDFEEVAECYYDFQVYKTLH